MNKKLLICGALATGLLLTACVKKEAPKEEDKEQAAASAVQQPPAQFENLETAASSQAEQTEIPPQVEVSREETNNTSTTIRREYHEPREAAPRAVETATPSARAETHAVEAKPEVKPAKAESVKTETVKAEAKPKVNTGAQTEDDAVAAAIAAATPALKN